MAHADIALRGLAGAIARFPEHAAALRRLMLADPEFRSLCEDYALAQASLARFEASPDADRRPEVGEYRGLITELEREIVRFLEQD